MLIKNAASYLLARGVPGIVNFLALAVYTRLLTPDDYGRYALALSFVGLAQVMLFQSIQLVLMRFLPTAEGYSQTTLNHVLSLFLCMMGAIATLGLGVVFFAQGTDWLLLACVAVALTLSQAWLELNLQLAAIRLEPLKYGLISAGRAIVALGLGGFLAWVGVGAKAPMVGLIVGGLSSWLIWGSGYWKNARPKLPNKAEFSNYAAYGLPLVATFALVWVVTSSDRALLSYFMGDEATGVYAAGYDLAQNSLGLLLAIINTAATPLVINALERRGVDAAKAQLKENGELIFAVAFSGAAGLIAIGPQLLHYFVGADFREGALIVFPWIALSAAIVGIKSFHFDIAFHVSKKSKWLVISNGAAAVVNVIANVALIPRYGILGAAWATIIAFFVAMVFSCIIGKGVFPMPRLLTVALRPVFIAVILYLLVSYVGHFTNGLIGLMVCLVLGMAVFVTSLLILNIGASRGTFSGFRL